MSCVDVNSIGKNPSNVAKTSDREAILASHKGICMKIYRSHSIKCIACMVMWNAVCL
jgi:hypothetical protein